MRVIFVLLSTLALVACAPRSAGPDSPYFAIPEGSTAVLEQAVTVPSPGVSVWIQNGAVSTARNRWEPACKLEMWTRTDSSRTVEPDSFRIERVARNDRAVAADPGFRRVALDNSPGDGPMAYEMETILYLKSARQPDVHRLVCSYWDSGTGIVSAFPQHLTFNQIAGTLAGVFRLQLP
ncbi:MAG: hypothetical protein M0R77_12055 [Gammaproteobacteria bacterium]|nr:hypothetical protein [Gammaproteobacteria bacterium]